MTAEPESYLPHQPPFSPAESLRRQPSTRPGRQHGWNASAGGVRARPASDDAGQIVTSVLTTDGLRPAEREAFWRHALSGLLPVSVTILGEGSVEGSVRLNRAGRVVVAEGKATSQDVRRTARDISQSQPEYFQLAVVASGVCRVSQDGRQAELHAGDWAAYESFRPVQLLFDGNWHACTFTFPRETVRLSDSERQLMTARRMDGRTGMTGVVSRFLLDLARTSGDAPAKQWELALLQTSDLVASLLGVYADPSEAVRGCLQRTVMLKIKDYIAQRLCDPGLRPPEIAAAANVSVRYLHKLFEAEHRPVSQYIKGLRLERSRRELLDPRLADRSVAAVAFACGFGDLSGFNRAFKEAYGTSPRKLRTARASDDPGDRGLPNTCA